MWFGLLELIGNAIYCVKSCKSPPGGINPTTSVNTAVGNSTTQSESWYNSVKTVATVNLSGSAGALVIFSIVFLLVVITYKRLSNFVKFTNNRLQNLYTAQKAIQPSIELSEIQRNSEPLILKQG